MRLIYYFCAFASLVFMLGTTPAHAQSSFEKPFGLGRPRAELPPPMPSYRAPICIPSSRPFSTRQESETRRPTGKVRTICVRPCDGFYFPISHATSARSLTADNDQCKARCGSDSRLFYSIAADELDPAAMIDLTGRRYDALENAFAYRKSLRPGCSCRLPPWSSAERLRHFQYALAETQAETMALAATELKSDSTLAGQDVAEDAATSYAGRKTVTASELTDRAPVCTRLATEACHEPARARRRYTGESRAQRASEHSARQRYSKANSSPGIAVFFSFGQQQKSVWLGDAR
jgi:hypothetical protein